MGAWFAVGGATAPPGLSLKERRGCRFGRSLSEREAGGGGGLNTQRKAWTGGEVGGCFLCLRTAEAMPEVSGRPPLGPANHPQRPSPMPPPARLCVFAGVADAGLRLLAVRAHGPVSVRPQTSGGLCRGHAAVLLVRLWDRRPAAHDHLQGPCARDIPCHRHDRPAARSTATAKRMRSQSAQEGQRCGSRWAWGREWAWARGWVGCQDEDGDGHWNLRGPLQEHRKDREEWKQQDTHPQGFA